MRKGRASAPPAQVDLDDATRTDHFENVQSTNWRSMRWKPPPPDAPGMG